MSSVIATEHEAQARAFSIDSLLAELVRQRGTAKLCYDEEDGWFVQFLFDRNLDDSWQSMCVDEQRHARPTDALSDAVRAHNEEVGRAIRTGRYTHFSFINLPNTASRY